MSIKEGDILTHKNGQQQTVEVVNRDGSIGTVWREVNGLYSRAGWSASRIKDEFLVDEPMVS